MRGSAIATSVLAAVVALAAPGRAQPRGDDDSAALVETGRRALQDGDLGGAAKALDQALALNPRRVEAYVLRAAVFAARGDTRSSSTELRSARTPAVSASHVNGRASPSAYRPWRSNDFGTRTTSSGVA